MSNIDYAARKNPEAYKPLLDAEFAKLVELVGGDKAEVQKHLDSIDTEGCRPWDYLTSGINATKKIIFTEKLQEALGYSWTKHLWQAGDQYTCFGGMSEDDFEQDPDDFETNYIIGEYYPEESHEALQQDDFWGGSDADVVGLWSKDAITKIFRAHMEGFWILGEDPVDFFQKEVGTILSKSK